MNPLLSPPETPFSVPPFHAIRPEHFLPAFTQALQTHRAEIDAIGANPAPPDFANTIEALQRSGRDITRIEAIFTNLVSSLGGAPLEAVECTVSPILAQHFAQIATDEPVFLRIDALHETRHALALAPDQKRLLERLHLTATRSGAALPPAGRVRMAAIAERLATLHTQFGQNVLHDEKTWHLPLAPADLEGLPAFVRTALREAAAERGLPGAAVTLSRSVIEPFLAHAPGRALRQAAHEAWIARGTHPGPNDNAALIPEILALRRERARLLGYPSFAAFRLADSMAATPDAARALLAEVWVPARARALAEREHLIAFARAQGFNGQFAAWDWRYYAERVRAAEYGLDEAEIKPFFTLASMQDAAFDTANRLFGLTFIEQPDISTYHPDVRSYEVRDSQGRVGIFMSDHFARADKRSGAWMSAYRDQEAMDDIPVAPIIVNNNNFSKSDPTLLSFDDARTLFHEFGHALHGLLSRVRYPTQSGTSVKRDFVEFPSQIYEHWLSLPATLQQFARHHHSGKPLPEALAARLLAAANFNQGFRTVEYTAAALLDLALHEHPDPLSLDVEAFERETLAAIGMPMEIGVRHRLAHFQHLFAGGGYAAGYYAYLWAEVLDADGFTAFTDTGDPFDPATAARLRTILEAGDTQDPMTLYKTFRGRAPTTEALLKGRDLHTVVSPPPARGENRSGAQATAR